MALKNYTPGCCNCGTTPTNNCTSPMTVYANYTCNGYVTLLPGAIITIKRRVDNIVVASGTTDINGRFQVYLPPITGDTNPPRGYETTATYKGYDPIGIGVSGGGTQAPGLPRRSWGGCSTTTTFGFPIFKWAATVVGCGNVVMPGVNVKVYKRYTNGSAATLLGQGTTDINGYTFIDFDIPTNDTTGIFGVATSSDFYQGFAGFAPGPGNNPNRCQFGFNISQQSGTPNAYPDIPDLDQSPRNTSNGFNAKNYQQCCFPQNGVAGRYRPYPATLHVTVGPYSFDVTSTGAIWNSNGFRAKMQGAALQPNGLYACNPNPYYHSEVNACISASVFCDGLGMSYVSCHGMQVPIDMDCATAKALLAQNPNALDYVGIQSSLTSRSGDPFVMEGESELGHWVVTE